MALVTTFCEFFGCGSGGGNPSITGSVVNLLSVDYEDDWIYLEGIEDVGFVLGPQRDATGLTAPTSGVKAKRASMTHNEVVVAAATIGYEANDCVFVVWAQTLTSSGTPFDPRPGDTIRAFDYDWIIKSAKRNVDFSQYRCVVKRSAKQA
jgi:hypothetical protein